MQMNLKSFSAGAQLLLFFGISILSFVLVSAMAAPALSAISGVSVFSLADKAQWKANPAGMSIMLRGLILAQFLGLFCLPSLLFAQWSGNRTSTYLGLRPPFRNSFWLLGLALLLVAFPLVELLGYWNMKMEFSGSLFTWMKEREAEAGAQVQFLTERHTLKELFLNLFFIAVLAGVGEELFFRGVLQRLLIRLTRSPWGGIVLTAFLFSAFHLQFFGFLPRFVLGILLGAMYWYSGSLWVSILAHFFYDALILTLLYASPELAKNPNATIIKTSMLLLPAAISLALLVFVLRKMKQSSKADFKEVYKDDFSSPNPFSF